MGTRAYTHLPPLSRHHYREFADHSSLRSMGLRRPKNIFVDLVEGAMEPIRPRPRLTGKRNMKSRVGDIEAVFANQAGLCLQPFHVILVVVDEAMRSLPVDDADHAIPQH